MPINAFGGGPGSGKTYGVIEHVILPAIAAGRFVITNIEGLNNEAIYEYVAKNFYKGKIICIGHIRTCSRSAPDEPGFFPGIDRLDEVGVCPLPDSPVVAGGDLVVIDEATRHWPLGAKLGKDSPAAFFFREHRHFANEVGHTCDLVVIDPDLTQLARALRGKIEMSSITHKLKSLGVNRYVVRLYRQCKLTGTPQSVNGPYSFRPEIYALYRSYSHANAVETMVDGRQNILRSKVVWLYLVGVPLMFVVAVYFAWGFFHRSPPVSPVAQSGAVGAAPAAQSHAVPASAVPASPAFSDRWRVVGSYTAKGVTWAVLSDASGRMRLESPSAFLGAGAEVSGDVDGARVTRWTGAADVRNPK